MIGSTFTEEGRNKLCGLLQRNLDIFAWKPANMTGVPRHIAEHRLNVWEGCSPVRQKKRGQAADRNQAIQEEVEKLVEAEIMKEVHYHDWVSNPVMVKKHDDSWRMNAGATYQRLADKAFHKQIGRNLEVYVDDLVIKSRTEDEIVRDIEETFKTLRKINMKLNPKKCTFEVEEGMFMGYKVNTKGLKVCPNKMKQLIAELPMLIAPMETEELIVYLAAAKETVKRRALRADFIVERPEEDSPDTRMEEEELPEPWILFTDGSSCMDGSKAGLILTNPEGMKFTYALRFRFDATNNEAEYEALIAGLRIAEQMCVKNLQANVDSRLVANQVNGTYVAKEVDMVRYMEKVKTLTSSFKAFTIKQIRRSENKKADALSKIASTSFAHLSKQVLVEELKEKSISEVEVLIVVKEEEDTWMTPIFKYLAEETLPADMKKAGAIKRKLWRNPQHKLTPITSPWPFYKWGIDIAGPFSEGLGKVKFLIVAMDYFTKWIEAKPVATITGNQIKNLCGTTLFAGLDFLERSSQTMENSSEMIHLKTGIKERLEERSKNWMEELPHVLWAHRTMIKSSNGDTPFSLTYGMKAVIPAEIGMPTLRTAEVDLIQNNEALEINLDLLEERREEAAIREAKNPTKKCHLLAHGFRKIISYDISKEKPMSNKELESKVEDMVEEVKTKMGELFGTYKERFDFLSSNSSMGEHMESEVTSPNNGDNDFLNDYYNVDATSSYETETELDRYLREPKIELRKGQSLDILQWWKVNGPRFPIVSKMARYILAIQISTVASEAAFSTGERALDPYRTRLSTTIVEALICTQDWVRKSRRDDVEDLIKDDEIMKYMEEQLEKLTERDKAKQTGEI
ncbi:reverse transcriptase domain-containing protein [Tanacetum coccineum]